MQGVGVGPLGIIATYAGGDAAIDRTLYRLVSQTPNGVGRVQRMALANGWPARRARVLQEVARARTAGNQVSDVIARALSAIVQKIAWVSGTVFLCAVQLLGINNDRVKAVLQRILTIAGAIVVGYVIIRSYRSYGRWILTRVVSGTFQSYAWIRGMIREYGEWRRFNRAEHIRQQLRLA